jgi:hypothetical protein
MGEVMELVGWLSQYVLAEDVPALTKSCRERGYRSAADIVAAGEHSPRRLAALGVSTQLGRRMLLRELRRLEAPSPSVSEPDEPARLSAAQLEAVDSAAPPPGAGASPALSPEPEPEPEAEPEPVPEPAYLRLAAAAPSPASDWPIPPNSLRLPTLLQVAQRRLAFAQHLLSRSSAGGGATRVWRSAFELLDIDVVQLVGQLAVGEASPLDRVLSAAGLAPDKTVIVERHLGLVGLMGPSFRLDALAAMCFSKDARHGKHRGKWRSLVSELLLVDGGGGGGGGGGEASQRPARPSILSLTTSINATRHHSHAQLRQLSAAEKAIEAQLVAAVRALPTGVALRQAASEGAAEELHRLVHSGADVRSTDDTGCTALWLAAYHGHSRAVSLLVSHLDSADLEQPNEAGMTALMAAACHGSVDTLKVLLEAGVDWRKRDTDEGRTAMDWAKCGRTAGTAAAAAAAAATDAVLLLQSWLLEHGSVEETQAFLDEALRQAVTDGCEERPFFCERFLDFKTPIILPRQARDRHRKSCEAKPFFCCRVLRTELEVQRLVASGAKIDSVDGNGATPLHLAAGEPVDQSTRGPRMQPRVVGDWQETGKDLLSEG